MNFRRESPGVVGMQTLFLCSLVLYPFEVAGHTLYLIPQILLLVLGMFMQQSRALIPQKCFIAGLAAVAGTLALLREALADRAAFLEPTKLVLNLSTLLLLVFLVPVFDPIESARWLKRFALVWLAVILAAYISAGTSTWQMLMLLMQPEGVTSTRLYELADPLTPIFLTKNILAMYFVAVFGCFLYFRRSAGARVSLLEKVLFVLLVTLAFSRQAFLAVVVLLSIDYFYCAGPKRRRWWPVLLLAAGLIVGLFLTFAFNFTSYQDGATTRLELWRVFFDRWTRFAYLGLGVHDLNASLDYLSIDNYHMFFMNQIAAYGIVHCLAFNLLLAIITFRTLPTRARWLLLAPFWLNVCFQTYGYEYGNLFLYCVAANSMNLAFPAQSPASLQTTYPFGAPLEAR